jgi:ABC-2 type transport system ATP-binding protein
MEGAVLYVEPVIVVKEVKKEFKVIDRREGLRGSIRDLFSRNYKTVKAVDGVSMEIFPGEIVGYLGPNGAGKSTTIKMMTGILEPTSGMITVNGLIPYKNRVRNAKNIGVVFGQRTQLRWALPVIESFKLLKEMYRISDRDYQDNLELFRSVIGKEDLFKTTVRQMSLGQRTLCDIMASFLHNPNVVFLDEPTIGLDVTMKAKIREIIKILNKKNTTVILTTHDMGDVDALCHRTIIIDKGNVLYDDRIKNLHRYFGDYRTLSLNLTRNSEEIKDSRLEQLRDEVEKYLMKRMFPNSSVTVSLENKSICILINEEKVTAMTVINCIQEKYRIYDLSIKDISTENVIKKIYAGDGE